MQRNIGKIISENVPVLDAVVFIKFCAINLCVKKRYIKKSFCFGFRFILVVVSAVLQLNTRAYYFFICFSLRHKKASFVGIKDQEI